jgi:hypothetical protein
MILHHKHETFDYGWALRGKVSQRRYLVRFVYAPGILSWLPAGLKDDTGKYLHAKTPAGIL